MDVVNGLLPVEHQPGFCSGVLCVIPVTKPQFCCCELVPLACCTAPALHGESSAMLSCVCRSLVQAAPEHGFLSVPTAG